jgi:putative MFS transporter
VFAVGSLGGAIIWFLRRRLPESPRWLETAGRHAEASAVVSAMEAEAGGPHEVTGGPEVATPLVPSPSTVRPARVPLRVIFSREYRGRTLMLWVFQIFQAVGYYGFGTLVPIVLTARGFSVTSSLTYTTLVFLGYPLGAALSIPILERVDRKWLIVGSAFLMAVFGFALGYAWSAAVIVPLGVAYTMASNIFSNAFHVFQAEIFPTSVRATAAGTAYGLSRLSSAAMPFVLLPLLSQSGPVAAFSAVGAAMLIVMIDIALFAPSTTGRTLEDVAA